MLNKRLAAVLAVFASTFTLLMPVAVAAPNPESDMQKALLMIHRSGVNMSDQDLYQIVNLVCARKNNGSRTGKIREELQYSYGLDSREAGIVIGAATRYVC